MDWLSQNWIWIALATGAFFFMTRMSGHGMRGSMRHSYGGGGTLRCRMSEQVRERLLTQ